MTSTPRVRSLLACLAVTLAALAPALPARATAAKAGPTGSLTVIVGYEPGSLDPAVDYDTGGNTYFGSVYEKLVQAVGERQVKIVPQLAKSWQESRDGKTWTFHLRHGMKFHDGSTVNAQAVKFTFDRMLAAKQGAYADFTEIQRVTVFDPYTVVFHLKYAFSSFLPSLSCLDGADIVSPKTARGHKISSSGASYLNDHDAGSGPYELVSYQHHQRIVLKAFPGYWGGWSGHHVARVVITWPASSSTQRLELERGGADTTMNLSNQDFNAVTHEPGIHVVQRKGQTIRDIRINTTKRGLNNVLVRQALSDAFDYQGVVRGVFGGLAARMQGVGPTGFKNFVPESHLYSFDLNRAKQLLKQSGYKNLSFTIAYLPDDTQAIQMAQIFQADLARIGVKTKLQGIPIATYSQVVQKPSTDPDIWIGAWTMDCNDDAQMYWSYYLSSNVPPVGGNVMYYKDPTTDRLLQRGVRATNARTAYRYFAEVCHRVYAQAPNIWTVQPDERIALRNNIHGYAYNYEYSAYYYPLYNMWRS